MFVEMPIIHPKIQHSLICIQQDRVMRNPSFDRKAYGPAFALLSSRSEKSPKFLLRICDQQFVSSSHSSDLLLTSCLLRSTFNLPLTHFEKLNFHQCFLQCSSSLSKSLDGKSSRLETGGLGPNCSTSIGCSSVIWVPLQLPDLNFFDGKLEHVIVNLHTMKKMEFSFFKIQKTH